MWVSHLILFLLKFWISGFCSKLIQVFQGMEELRYALFYTNLELETTIMSAKEEISRRECEIMNLRDLLDRAIKEKDEFEAKCGKLMLENLFLLEQHKNQELEITPQSDSDSSKIFDCSGSDDNATQSPQTDPIVGEPLLLKDLPPTVCKNACKNEKPLLCKELPPTVCKNACENEKPMLSQELPPTVCKNACENEKPLLSQEHPTVRKNACENEKPLLSQEHPPTVWKNACENKMPLLSQELPPTVHKNACENEKPLLSQEPPSSVWKNACEKQLPQKGKLLQAVIEAGPLLQNLLLAGPLPHWQHPPLLINSSDIPPVIISPRPSRPLAQSSAIDIRKRTHSHLSEVSQHSQKHQKVAQ